MVQEKCSESVLCTYTYTVHLSPDTDWSVMRYRSCSDGRQFTAVGNSLPHQKSLTVELFGQWVASPRNKGKQLQVSYYTIPKQEGTEGLISYFKAMKCGVGRLKATMIYDRFGDEIWDILDKSPERLAEVRGISSKTVQKLQAGIKENAQLRALMLMCRDLGIDIPVLHLKKIVDVFGPESEREIKENPYSMISAGKVSFSDADDVAAALEFPKDSPYRLNAAITAVLMKASAKGHVYLPEFSMFSADGNPVQRGIASELSKMLHLDEAVCSEAVEKAVNDGIVRREQSYICLPNLQNEEDEIAENLMRLATFPSNPITGIEPVIQGYEKDNIPLASNQKDAIRNVFLNQVSIITGGPGTGKTTVIKAILHVHRTVLGSFSCPVLLAPTGKSARRMTEATGYPAQTIHSAVGYIGDDMPALQNAVIEGNLIVIDESSMMDQKITSILLSKIPIGARIVFVGDPDQLPPVGYGNVMKDMIDSQVIPTTKLNVIYRQAEDNPIVFNCHQINKGCTDLRYSSTFKFIETKDDAQTFNEACCLYLKSVRAFGLDNVILLNPQRNNTNLSVDAFNFAIQKYLHEHMELLNIQQKGRYTIRSGKNEYRVGDKVVQTKNSEAAKNGDTGYIKDIIRMPDPDDPTQFIRCAEIEFSNSGTTVEYTLEQMKNLELAYCLTVHRVQGCEYKTVIEVVSDAHPVFARRQIVYTACSRSKENFAAVGQMKTFNEAILNGGSDIRFTRLCAKLRSELK